MDEGKDVKNSETFRDYHNSPREDDKESQKRTILQTATKLNKSDIKTTGAPLKDTYPNRAEL